MKIDPLPRMRTQGPEICFMIVGEGSRAGSVKSVRYGSGVNSELLSVSLSYDEAGNPYHELHPAPQYQSKGWRLLYDQYLKEDGDDGRYFEFLKFHHAATRGRVHVNASDESIIPGLPNYMLPAYCVELASKAADPSNGMWVPPPPPEDAKPKEVKARGSRKAELG